MGNHGNATLADWRRTIDFIVDELTRLSTYHSLWHAVYELAKNNPNIGQKRSIFWLWMWDAYWSTVGLGIRRMVDKHDGTISLVRLLEQIKNNPAKIGLHEALTLDCDEWPPNPWEERKEWSNAVREWFEQLRKGIQRVEVDEDTGGQSLENVMRVAEASTALQGGKRKWRMCDRNQPGQVHWPPNGPGLSSGAAAPSASGSFEEEMKKACVTQADLETALNAGLAAKRLDDRCEAKLKRLLERELSQMIEEDLDSLRSEDSPVWKVKGFVDQWVAHRDKKKFNELVKDRDHLNIMGHNLYPERSDFDAALKQLQKLVTTYNRLVTWHVQDQFDLLSTDNWQAIFEEPWQLPPSDGAQSPAGAGQDLAGEVPLEIERVERDHQR